MRNVRIFSAVSGRVNRPNIADSVCAHFEIPEGKIIFSKSRITGELSVKLEENVEGWHTVIVHPVCTTTNIHLVDLVLTINELRENLAASITVVLPCFGYHERNNINSLSQHNIHKMVAAQIEAAGATQVITLDLPKGRHTELFGIPATNVYTTPDTFGLNEMSDLVIVGADGRSDARARWFSTNLGLHPAFAYEIKGRTFIAGDISGKNAMVVSNAIGTAKTLARVAHALENEGAKEVTILCTHAINTSEAFSRLHKQKISKILVTDTVVLPPKTARRYHVSAVSAVPVLAHALEKQIERMHLSHR